MGNNDFTLSKIHMCEALRDSNKVQIGYCEDLSIWSLLTDCNGIDVRTKGIQYCPFCGEDLECGN